jgi:hypothetical protein
VWCPAWYPPCSAATAHPKVQRPGRKSPDSHITRNPAWSPQCEHGCS